MMKSNTLYFFGLMMLIIACTQSTKPTVEEKAEEPTFEYLHGEWTAKWVTDPGSYPDSLSVASFSMDGKWIFKEDQTMSIAAYGFEGCIFGEDTLNHTQNWEVRNDSILMKNDQQIVSLTCQIVERSEKAIKLQLLPDISVNLTRE